MLRSLREKDIRLGARAVGGLHLLAAIIILVIFSLFTALAYWDILPPRKDLYNELWGPAHLLVRGRSPYDTASLDPNLPGAWLPMSIGLFAPMGWLEESVALYSWFVFNLAEICLMVIIVQREFRPFHPVIITALFSFAFPPTIYSLLLGQFSITTTLCTVAATALIVKRRHWAGAFLLALGLSKPHLMTVTMLGLSAWYFQNHGARSMVQFWARTIIAALILCVPLFVSYPNWIPDALASMRSNAPWAFPTFLEVLRRNLGFWGIGLWGIAMGVVILLALSLWKRTAPPAATYWSLGLALLVSPYLGNWDFVTLLPLLIHTFMQSNWKPRIFIVICYLIAWYGMALIQSLEESHNYYFWWIPFWFLGTLALAPPRKLIPPECDDHQAGI
jgi:hypothetical protein